MLVPTSMILSVGTPLALYGRPLSFMDGSWSTLQSLLLKLIRLLLFFFFNIDASESNTALISIWEHGHGVCTPPYGSPIGIQPLGHLNHADTELRIAAALWKTMAFSIMVTKTHKNTNDSGTFHASNQG